MNDSTDDTATSGITMASLMSVAQSALVLLLWSFSGFPRATTTTTANPSFSNSATSLTFLYQNNLNASDDINHVGAILLDAATPDWCLPVFVTGKDIAANLGATRPFRRFLEYILIPGLFRCRTGRPGILHREWSFVGENNRRRPSPSVWA